MLPRPKPNILEVSNHQRRTLRVFGQNKTKYIKYPTLVYFIDYLHWWFSVVMMENLHLEFFYFGLFTPMICKNLLWVTMWIFKWSAPLMFQLWRIYCGVTWRIRVVWEQQQQQQQMFSWLLSVQWWRYTDAKLSEYLRLFFKTTSLNN